LHNGAVFVCQPYTLAWELTARKQRLAQTDIDDEDEEEDDEVYVSRAAAPTVLRLN